MWKMSLVLPRAASASSVQCLHSLRLLWAEKQYFQLAVTQPTRQEIIYKNSVSKHLLTV